MVDRLDCVWAPFTTVGGAGPAVAFCSAYNGNLVIDCRRELFCCEPVETTHSAVFAVFDSSGKCLNDSDDGGDRLSCVAAAAGRRRPALAPKPHPLRPAPARRPVA